MQESEEQKIQKQEPLFVSVKTNDGKMKKMELKKFLVGSDKVLSFKPKVVEALLAEQGMKFRVNEQSLFEISSSSGSSIPFGTNNFGLIGIFAVDIARLPYREQCIWVAHQCPENEFPKEIERAELEHRTINTIPPESLFCHALESIDRVFYSKFGVVLLKKYNEEKSLIEKIHRFQVTNQEKLCHLAKEVVKVSIRRMDKQALLDALNKEESNTNALHLLQELLANENKNYTCEKMKPLFGVYDMAKADSDLPNSDIQSCYTSLDINQDVPYILQAIDLLQGVTRSLTDVSEELNRNIGDK